MELKSWIFCRYGSPTAIIHPKTSPNIDKSTFKCTHCNKIDPTNLDIPQFQSNDSWYDQETMRNRGFEPWTFKSCLGNHHFDSKKTSIAIVAEIKIEANVAEKVSALVAATDYGAITSAILDQSGTFHSINFQTPLQALTNAIVAPTVPNLPPRVFDCVAFVHLHKHQRTKLTSHALQCVFVGYALHKRDIDVTILQLNKCILQWILCFMKIRCIFHLSRTSGSTIRKFRLSIMIIISLRRMNRTIELVNQEAGELDMNGQQFGSKMSSPKYQTNRH
ncbi:hypothetical protein AAG906_037858 [Vitis piasezkii]